MLQTELFAMPIASAGTRRLFIGLMAEGQAQAAVDRHRHLWHWPPGASLPPPGRLHLTLHFLGEVEAAAGRALARALPAVPMEPLDLVLDTAEVWRNGVATLQPREHAGLRLLHARLGGVLGFGPDARWKPHVTLARKASQALPPEAFAPIAWRVAQASLVWSHLGQDGTRYETLARTAAGTAE